MTALISLLALAATASEPAAEPNPFVLSPAPVVVAPADDGKKSLLSYTYIEANYLWADYDGFDDSLDGWEARASFEIPLGIFLQATYSQLSGDADVDTWRFGAGWHLPIGQKLDVYGLLSATGQDIEADLEDEDDASIAAEAGARFLLGEKIELNGRILWSDLEESDTTLGAGGRFYFSDAWSVGLNADFGNDVTYFAAGLRFQF
jgi:hypothetical protein